jgi:hypothetical protein
MMTNKNLNFPVIFIQNGFYFYLNKPIPAISLCFNPNELLPWPRNPHACTLHETLHMSYVCLRLPFAHAARLCLVVLFQPHLPPNPHLCFCLAFHQTRMKMRGACSIFDLVPACHKLKLPVFTPNRQDVINRSTLAR